MDSLLRSSSQGGLDAKKNGSSDMKKSAEEGVAKTASGSIVVTKLILWAMVDFEIFKKILLTTSKHLDTQSFLYYSEPKSSSTHKSIIYFINTKLKEGIPHTTLGCEYLNSVGEFISPGGTSKIKFKVYEFQDRPRCVGFFHWKTYDFYQKSLVKSSGGKISLHEVEKLTGEELAKLAKEKGVVVTPDAYGTFFKTVTKDQKRTIQKLSGPISIDKIDKLREFLIPI